MTHERRNQLEHTRKVGVESITGKRVVPDPGWRWWRAGRGLPVEHLATKAELLEQANAACRQWTGATAPSS